MPRHRRWLWICPCVALLAGCGDKKTRVDIVSFDNTGRTQQHFSEFRHASYRLSASGLLEVVMRTERPSTIDPTQIITQVLYIKTFWNPRPGTTYVEATQINAKVEYAMLTLPTGVRYDGAAFLSYKVEGDGDLVAHVESATITPRYRLGDAVEPFGPARFTATIRAQSRPRDIVNAAQLLDLQFRESVPVSPPAN